MDDAWGNPEGKSDGDRYGNKQVESRNADFGDDSHGFLFGHRQPPDWGGSAKS